MPNTPPRATNTSFSTPMNTAFSGNIGIVDDDGDMVSSHQVSPFPTKGSLQLMNGAFTYSPRFDQQGVDSFGVWLSDGHNPPVVVNININIVPTGSLENAELAWTQEQGSENVFEIMCDAGESDPQSEINGAFTCGVNFPWNQMLPIIMPIQQKPTIAHIGVPAWQPNWAMPNMPAWIDYISPPPSGNPDEPFGILQLTQRQRTTPGYPLGYTLKRYVYRQYLLGNEPHPPIQENGLIDSSGDIAMAISIYQIVNAGVRGLVNWAASRSGAAAGSAAAAAARYTAQTGRQLIVVDSAEQIPTILPANTTVIVRGTFGYQSGNLVLEAINGGARSVIRNIIRVPRGAPGPQTIPPGWTVIFE